MAGRVVELVFRGDNRSAVRSLMGISEASDRTTRNVKRDARTNTESFRQVGESTHRLRGSVSGLLGTVGLGGLALGFKDVIEAGQSWQAQQAQLRNALRNTGTSGTDTMRKLMDAAEALSTHGGFGAQQNLQGLTQFVRQSGDAELAINRVTLATNIARASGRSFQQVLRALMMAEQGRATGLARLGVAVPKVTTATDTLRAAQVKHRDGLLALEAAGYKFTAAQKAQYAIQGQVTPAMLAQARAQDQLATKQRVFALLQQRYLGATATYSRTTAGRISNMRNAWETLQKQIGSGLLPVTNKLLTVLSDVFGWLDSNRLVLYGLLAATAAVSGVLATHAIIVATVNAKTYALTAAQRLLGLSSGAAAAGEEGATAATIGLGGAMDALPIIAIIAGLVLLATHFDLVKRAATVAWQWIKRAAADTWNWIKGHWPLLAGILLAPFTFGVSIIVGLFHKQIIGAAKSAWDWLKNAAGNVFNALTWPFREAWKLISGVFGKIKSVGKTIIGLPGKIVHGAGSVLSTVTGGLLHTGGPVKAKYLASGGPTGIDTVPLWGAPGEYMLNRQMVAQAGMSNLERWRSGGQMPGERVVIEPAPVQLYLDGRVVAEAVATFTVKKGARGASSLVGGAMVTGARTG